VIDTGQHRLLIRTITAVSPNDRYPAAPQFTLVSTNGRLRRILPVPVRPDEGHLTEPTTAVQPSRREPLYAPNPTLTVAGSKRRGSGGFAPFTAASRIGTTVVLGQPSDRPPVARPALIGYFVPLGFSSG
jgi:hypothetical protein